MSAGDFWIPYQWVFFYVMIFDPYAQRYCTKNSDKMLQTNKKEKNAKYNERALQIQNGLYGTPAKVLADK